VDASLEVTGASLRRVRAITAGLLVAVLCAIGLSSTPVASASTSDVDPSASVTFIAGLPIRSALLRADAQAVSSPGTERFRKFMTLREAAKRYGASDSAVDRARSAMAPFGLTTALDATRMFVRITGTVAQWQSAFGAPIEFRPAAQGSPQAGGAWDVFAFASPQGKSTAVPPALVGKVPWFISEFSRYVPSMDVPGAQPLPVIPSGLAGNNGTPVGTTCLPPSTTAVSYTPDQLSHAYALNGINSSIPAARQPRIAIVSLAGGFAQSDVDAAAACFGHRSPAVDVRYGVGVGSPIVSLSGETALDLQTVSWAAHDLESVRLVQVTNSDQSFFEGFALALSGWATPPDAVTVSYGNCEADELEGYQTIEALHQLAATIGTSVLVAAGDWGSSACQVLGSFVGDEAAMANPVPTIAMPASSPFVTAVGGTQLNLGAGNDRVGESVWNDVQYGLTGNAASTAGPSGLWNAPWYQRPINASQVRSVPDIALQAGVGPGTTIFIGGVPVSPVGGTSQASPLAAAGFALISARLRAEGKPPLGFLNPWLYRVGRTHASSFYDVTIGNTLYPVTTSSAITLPPCCQATPGFDAASGLGAPLFGRLNQVTLS